MYILGVNPGIHDATAALLKDGQLLCMIEQERISRSKRAINQSPADAIQCCLDWAGITLDDIEVIAVGWDVPRMPALYKKNFDEETWLEWLLPPSPLKCSQTPPVRFIPHHLAHAASAFWTSGLEQAAVIVIDGSGETQATTIYKGNKSEIQLQEAWDITQSLGFFYEEATAWAGFTNHDAGKLMGLAAYGVAKQSLPLVPTATGYTFIGSQPPHRHAFAQSTQQRALLLDYFKRYNYPFCPGDKTETMAYANFAASVQDALQEAVLQLVRVACERVGCNNVVLAGGVAMNCTLNGYLARSGLVEDLYVPPVPFDAGVSLGAAMVVDRELYPDHAFLPRMRHAYWLPPVPASTLEDAIQASGLQAHQLEDRELTTQVAEHIATGHIVGWFQDRAEVGQRALGARSILGDPRQRSNLVRINTLKGREMWRPLAPSVLEEYAQEVFEATLPSPTDFMLAACFVRPDIQPKLPAVVHVDGSARPQLVRRETNPRYWQLIEVFREMTGIPAIINTSFNLAGEPIVYRPQEAISTFCRSELDVLVLNDFLLEKPHARLALSKNRHRVLLNR